MLEDPRHIMGKNRKQVEQRCTTSMKYKHTKTPAKEDLRQEIKNVAFRVDNCGLVQLKGIYRSSYF